MLQVLNSSSNSYWPLYLAAAESRLLIHSTAVVGVNPSDPTIGGDKIPHLVLIAVQNLQGVFVFVGLLNPDFANKHYLEECVEFLEQLVVRQPLLYYHLSIVYALLGRGNSSKKSWTRFVDTYM